MSTMSEDSGERDTVEALLQQAVPRPAPPADVEREVRESIEAEWQQVIRRSQSRRRMLRAALAASIALAAVLTFQVLNVTTPPATTLASVDKLHGPVYRLGADAELIKLGTAEALTAGELVVTHEQAGIGLRWSGASSLRIDADTRLEIVSENEVFLHTGRVYFDSQASVNDAAGPATLAVSTPHGVVRHVGTQYMAEVDGTTLRVSVREGSVAVAGRLYDGSASRGQQLAVSGDGRPVMTNISSFSNAWQWVEATAPGIDVDGMSTWDFLHWVGRETGLEVRFASARAEEIARRGKLRGRVNADPRTELRIRMLGEDLGYSISAGILTVSVSE